MFTEARKLHLIEEVLKIGDEHTLSVLEAILKKTAIHEDSSENPFTALSGIWSEEEALEIETAISENCEQVNRDDWK